MFKEIKVIETHHTVKESGSVVMIERKNTNNKKGSVELENLDKKYKHLVSKDTTSYDCRTYSNVTFFITTYLFSTHVSSI